MWQLNRDVSCDAPKCFSATSITLRLHHLQLDDTCVATGRWSGKENTPFVAVVETGIARDPECFYPRGVVFYSKIVRNGIFLRAVVMYLPFKPRQTRHLNQPKKTNCSILHTKLSADCDMDIVLCLRSGPPRVVSGYSKRIFAPPPPKAKNIYTYQEGWLSIAVPWAWSERLNLYNQRATILPRNTKTYAK
jgi:hypothetical protein